MFDDLDTQECLDELCIKMSDADRDRALAAMLKVLDDAGFDRSSAADSEFKLQEWVESGFSNGGELTEVEAAGATTWCLAVEAARVELCDKPPYLSEEAFCYVDFLRD